MAEMTMAQIRHEVTLLYPGADWPYKVEKMSDNQVRAIFYRNLEKKRKKGNK